MQRILLIDDNEMIREMLRRRLEQHGYEVILGSDGGSALSAALDHSPDLVMIDLEMPIVDGREAIRQLRENPQTCLTPIIALTENAIPQQSDKLYVGEYDEILVKPVQMPKLAKILSELLAKRASAPSLTKTLPIPNIEREIKPDPPRQVAVSEVVPDDSTEGPALPTIPQLNKRILVVEDNDVNRELLVRRLVNLGFQVAQAENGRVALQRVVEIHVDVVLLDVMMPEVDGYQVLKKLKAHADYKAIPVIMMSANDAMESVVRCIEMGAEDYLPKPVDPVLLKARIDACIDKRRLRDQEMVYLRALSELTISAVRLEEGKFEAGSLANLANREDELGQLARVFQKMAEEVQSREQSLQREVLRLKVEIDDIRKTEQVMEITETDYFQQLQIRAQELRQRFRRSATIPNESN
jgi:two-component system, cell cycle response regulator